MMKHDNYTVRVASRAESRLADHFEFLARASKSAAEKLLENLYSDMESLALHPHRNPRYTRTHTPLGEYRWMLSHGRYRIIYEVFEEKRLVYVVDIEDCRQKIQGE